MEPEPEEVQDDALEGVPFTLGETQPDASSDYKEKLCGEESSPWWRRGDLIFWDLKGTSVEPSHIDHAQIVTRVDPGHYVKVAQHTKNYEHTLAYVMENQERLGHHLGENIEYVVLEPIHTAANIE